MKLSKTEKIRNELDIIQARQEQLSAEISSCLRTIDKNIHNLDWCARKQIELVASLPRPRKPKPNAPAK